MLTRNPTCVTVDGGKPYMMYTAQYSSPVGRLLIAAENNALAGLWIEGQKHYPHELNGNSAHICSPSVLSQAFKWLDLYFSGKSPSPKKLPLSPKGTSFQKLIWNTLLEIPYGETMTYGEIAKAAALRMGISSMSPQAVGGAVGRNPLSIIIPCHRVIGSDGSLTGYAGGLNSKQWLLRHEGVKVKTFSVIQII